MQIFLQSGHNNILKGWYFAPISRYTHEEIVNRYVFGWESTLISRLSAVSVGEKIWVDSHSHRFWVQSLRWSVFLIESVCGCVFYSHRHFSNNKRDELALILFLISNLWPPSFRFCSPGKRNSAAWHISILNNLDSLLCEGLNLEKKNV